MQILPLLLCVKLRTLLTGAVPNPPDIGKDELKESVPMVTSSFKKGGYEEDINLW